MSTTHAGATGPGAPEIRRTAFARTAPRSGYALAAAVAVVGLTASSLWAVSGVLAETRRPAAFDRADLPGSVTLTVDEGDRVVVYVEADRRTRPDGGGAAQAVELDRLTVAGPAGDHVDLEDYPADLRYDVPASVLLDGALPDGATARVGTAVASFEADAAGTYTVTAAGAVHPTGGDGTPDVEGAILAVGEDLGAARAILLPVIAGVTSVLLAAGLVLRTAFRQARGSRS